MSTQKLEADLRVGAFGMLIDGTTRRLDFPRGEMDGLRGTAGSLTYGARELVMDRLHTRLDRTHWAAEACSAGDVFLKTIDGSLAMEIDRVEMSRGVQITRAAEGGIELIAPHVSLQDVKLTIPSFENLRGAKAATVAAEALRKAAEVPLRQDKLRFLDSLAGEISVRIKVVLDLPVLGTRTLDQALKIPIKDGSLDFRALDRSLDWLEGTFVDLGIKDGRLVLSWGVPIFVKNREIISWQLDDDARTLATFDRVPLRSLSDFRIPGNNRPATEGAPAKKSALRKLTVEDLKVSLSMAAPRSVEIGLGAILFGGDDAPGIVGLEVGGTLVHPPGPGTIQGALGVVDVTAKDLGIGPANATVDRLHLGGVESVSLSFDGFRPTGLTATIHRITATNLSLRLGATEPTVG